MPEPAVPAANGRCVLISGGDRGIGAAAARAFWQAGYRVAVLYHTHAEAAAALEKELADTKDQLLRLTAEYANFRKRSDKEKGDTYAYATGKTVEAFLPVFDNLERALGATQQDFEGLQKGVQMTFDGLTATLEKLGVTAYGAPGETFDPNLHHAVMHVEDENLDENVITDVFQRGYKMDDRIIRPAMVKTAN